MRTPKQTQKVYQQKISACTREITGVMAQFLIPSRNKLEKIETGLIPSTSCIYVCGRGGGNSKALEINANPRAY